MVPDFVSVIVLRGWGCVQVSRYLPDILGYLQHKEGEVACRYLPDILSYLQYKECGVACRYLATSPIYCWATFNTRRVG